MIKEQILPLFSGRIRQSLEKAELDYKCLREIRLRVNQPVVLWESEQCIYLGENGSKTQRICEAIRPMRKELGSFMEAACGYSGYAYEEEIKRGYVTIPGGHRIGLAGRVVLNGEKLQTIKYISAINIRIAHAAKGCARMWEKYFYEREKPCHMLIVSPPGCGKTTLLRDVIRTYSTGSAGGPAVTVGVVDERSEIAGTYQGIASYDLGIHTDVLDGCPKVLGMEMLLRSMAPQVIAVDEIGSGDVTALKNVLRCGCKILATMHGGSFEDFLEKPEFSYFVREKVFERYFFLRSGEKPGIVMCIYGRNFEKLWEEKECI